VQHRAIIKHPLEMQAHSQMNAEADPTSFINEKNRTVNISAASVSGTKRANRSTMAVSQRIIAEQISFL
jgi:hypothetical protein